MISRHPRAAAALEALTPGGSKRRGRPGLRPCESSLRADRATHLPMISAPFADFTWRHARKLAAQAGRDDSNQTEVAQVLAPRTAARSSTELGTSSPTARPSPRPPRKSRGRAAGLLRVPVRALGAPADDEPSRLSPRSGTGPRSPRAARGPSAGDGVQALQSAQDRWRAVNGPTSSHWSVPEPPSSTAYSSSGPVRKTRKKQPKRS